MSLFLQIATGLGLALAVGIRPFTPTLAAGGLARAGVLFAFRGTPYAFLQSSVFLLVVACLFAASVMLRARWFRELTATAAVALGGLLSAAVLAAHHDVAWPGLLAGALAAALATLATRPVFEGASERLGDSAARAAVTIYADGAALALAVLCWFVALFALAALVFVASLAWVQRSRLSTGLALLRVLR